MTNVTQQLSSKAINLNEMNDADLEIVSGGSHPVIPGPEVTPLIYRREVLKYYAHNPDTTAISSHSRTSVTGGW